MSMCLLTLSCDVTVVCISMHVKDAHSKATAGPHSKAHISVTESRYIIKQQLGRTLGT